MSENTNTQNNKNNDRPVPVVEYNNAGKTPSYAGCIFTVDEVRNEIFKLAKNYFTGLTKDRIDVSLVPDRNSTKYDKVTKTSRATNAMVFAIYFDKNDPNFVSPVDNVFSPMIKSNKKEVNKFIELFGARNDNGGDNDGRPFQPVIIQKGYDGKVYRCLVLDVESIFAFIMDGDGEGYKDRYGIKPPRVRFKLTPITIEDSGEVILTGFDVCKILDSVANNNGKAKFGNLNSAKIRGRVPRI